MKYDSDKTLSAISCAFHRKSPAPFNTRKKYRGESVLNGVISLPASLFSRRDISPGHLWANSAVLTVNLAGGFFYFQMPRVAHKTACQTRTAIASARIVHLPSVDRVNGRCWWKKRFLGFLATAARATPAFPQVIESINGTAFSRKIVFAERNEWPCALARANTKSGCYWIEKMIRRWWWLCYIIALFPFIKPRWTVQIC